MKINFSTEKDILNTVISMIMYNLLEYFRVFNVQNNEEIHLDNVNMILYIWDCDYKFFNIFNLDEINMFTNITIHEIREIVDVKFSMILKNEKNIPSEFKSDVIKLFIFKHWDQVHFVGKDKLQTWLCPSFLSFPMLTTAIVKTAEEFENE